MHQTRRPEEVAHLLRSWYAGALAGTIAIDGNDGVGKTTLALALQTAIGGTVVSIDEFVVENRGGYVPYLRSSEIKAALDQGMRPAIVEGVCVLAALECVSHQPDVLIYVERVDGDGYWHDEDTCDPSEPVDGLITRLAQEVAAIDWFDVEQAGEPPPKENNPGLTPLREEVIRYHARYRPSRRADIVFLRGAAA